ncbi:DUF2087 domain-containing protein [Zhihengliuella flava]|uniref:DUF2087 domain-containing protein n=1 Tax=Zhihengliuella flava TaxID=1285193 RepID=A0A931DDT8_9MICC|nr:DUF2087 domain-containing protein [Zhihengliuella flava]MBG6084960.1 hypothetical protein [Zhihengliuella flava]
MSELKRLAAVLANADQRRVLARLLLGEEAEPELDRVKPKAREKTRRALLDAGLAEDSGGVLALRESVFKELLAAEAPPRREGLDRFRQGARVVQWPAQQAERYRLMAQVAAEVLQPGEEVSEAELNGRLVAVHEDTAFVRRYLVDHALVRRAPDGSVYSLSGADEPSS